MHGGIDLASLNMNNLIDLNTGAATGVVKGVLRLEGLCVLVAATIGYAKYGAGWGVFAATFFLPDLSFAGYLAGPRAGAMAYNAAHSYVGAVIALAAALLWPSLLPVSVGLVWCAHIGFDRALGYGLKYGSGFTATHLGRIGRQHRPRQNQ